jgi:hypothetical protein
MILPGWSEHEMHFLSTVTAIPEEEKPGFGPRLWGEDNL